MSFFGLFGKKSAPVKQEQEPIIKKRAFAAAKVNRLTNDWTVSSKPINGDLKQGLRIVRARARDQAQNNDHVRQFLRMVKTNVIGHQGIILQSRVPDRKGKGVDREASAAIEHAFKKWGKKGSADVTGRLSWKMIQRLYVETLAKDGEVIIQKHTRFKHNKEKFSLEFIDVELLDVELNRDDLKNGRKIVMGVELDRYKRPIAYHFVSNSSSSDDYYSYRGKTYQRIAAANIYHDFIVEWVDQVRGIPWTASALTRLNMLGGYEEAELVASRVAASKMGFFEQDPEYDGDYVGDGHDEQGNVVTDAEAGTFEVLPTGMKVSSWDPQHPNSAFSAFVKATLRGVSGGLGVNYNTLANDLEGVSFGSLRQGALEDRAVWMALQDHVIESFCELVFNDWLANALPAGIGIATGGTLRGEDFDRYSVNTWQARRWQWLDPKKDMEGHKLGMQTMTKSPQTVITEQGSDPNDVLDQWQEWIAMLEERKIPLNFALSMFEVVDSAETPEEDVNDAG